MKERPILFSGAMVPRVLDRSKTQTRRVMKPQPQEDQDRKIGHIGPELHDPEGVFRTWLDRSADGKSGCQHDYNPQVWRCPYGIAGDRLYVRESYATLTRYDKRPPSKLPKGAPIWWVANGAKPRGYGRIRSSRFMPKRLARIWLEVAKVRVERLQDISEADAIAEGLVVLQVARVTDTARYQFSVLWHRLNGERHPWTGNPYIWVIEFKLVKP